MKHELKIKPEYFAAVFFGEKTFEIRNNADRNFQVGDTLMLKAWDGEFTGDFVEKVVSYITDFEQKPGYVVLGLVNHREHELLEKFHRTGVAIERAISTGSVLADHPLKSRLELLANHHEREMELAAQLSDATRQCGVMAGLLREVTQVIPAIGVAIDDLQVVDAFLERIEAALAGKLPDPAVTVTETIRTAPERIWLQVGDQEHYHSEPFPRDTSEVSWCADSVVGCEVPYVRADLAGQVLPLQSDQSLLDWAVTSWHEQVAYRPMENVYRRTLDSVWRQVIRFAGEDPHSIIGPSHDDLLYPEQVQEGGEPCATEHPSSSPD